MPRRIALIQGHPDPDDARYCRGLAAAYAKGARLAGHEVREIDVAKLEFPLLRTQGHFKSGAVPADIAAAQDAIGWADHLVIIYPLWLGTMPALLKAFFEQVFRPGFAFEYLPKGRWRKALKGRSARIVITMGMPAFFYRWFYRAHSLKSLERNILNFSGIGPCRETLIGMVEALGDVKRQKVLRKMSDLGRQGS